MDAVGEADGEVGACVVVVVADGAAEAGAFEIVEARTSCDVLPTSFAIAFEAAVGIGAGAYVEEVGLTVAVVVDDANAGIAWQQPTKLTTGRCGYGERNFDRSGGGGEGALGEFGERVAALIAIAGAEGRAEMLGGDFLEAGEMLARSSGVALALVGASDAEFGGGVERKS